VFVQHPFYQALTEDDHSDDLQVKVIDTEPHLYKSVQCSLILSGLSTLTIVDFPKTLHILWRSIYRLSLS